MCSASADRAVCFRLIGKHLAHIYGIVPRQGFIAARGSVKLEVCNRGHGKTRGTAAEKLSDKEEELATTKSARVRPPEVQGTPQEDPVFGYALGFDASGSSSEDLWVTRPHLRRHPLPERKWGPEPGGPVPGSGRGSWGWSYLPRPISILY